MKVELEFTNAQLNPLIDFLEVGLTGLKTQNDALEAEKQKPLDRDTFQRIQDYQTEHVIPQQLVADGILSTIKDALKQFNEKRIIT